MRDHEPDESSAPVIGLIIIAMVVLAPIFFIISLAGYLLCQI